MAEKIKLESRVNTEATKVTFPDGDEAVYVQFEIVCPECGHHKVRIAGHHLRVLRNFFIDTIDRYPTLCGDESSIRVVNTDTFAIGGTPGDPAKN